MKRWVLSSILLLGLALGLVATTSHATPVGVTAMSAVTAATSATATPSAESTPTTATPLTFAVIGDYGTNNAHAHAVGRLVASWNPAFVIAVGDDYYRVAGGVGTARYDRSTGTTYGRWLKDITTTGTRYPVGKAPVNAFFPALGNHDYSDAKPGPRTYLAYFTLPGADFTSSSGNERYYDFVEGPVHLFVLNSNRAEPNGVSSTSVQAQWLRSQLASSTSQWNVVYFHHPPFSSDKTHGSTKYMQWPFAAWGADAVISGHAHDYERVMRGGIPYFVNGLGGDSRYALGRRVAGSVIRYTGNFGAQKVTVTGNTMEFRFYNIRGRLIDRYTRSQP